MAEDDAEQDLVTYSTELERQPLMPQTGDSPFAPLSAPLLIGAGAALMALSLLGYRFRNVLQLSRLS